MRPAIRTIHLFWLVALWIYSLGTGGAADIYESVGSTVRILCPEPAKSGNGLAAVQVELPNGETVSFYSRSTGTGFVINNEGYVITNSHVAAEQVLSDVASKLILIVQKIDNRYVLHRGKAEWLSPNRDLAVIHCPDLKAKPLPLRFSDPKESAEVYSMGFPGISDDAVEDQDRVTEITRQLVLKAFRRLLLQAEQQLRRKPNKAEEEALYAAAVQDTPRWSAEMNAFFSALDGRLSSSSDAKSNSWDITDVVTKKSLWKGYFSPTVTKGNVEKVAQTRGFLGSGHDNISIIQHSCDIRAGNSGGPLLNADGQVVGVVGRGRKNNALEKVKWATHINEVKEWLDTHKVNYVLASASISRSKSALPFKIVAAIAIAISLAITALIVGLTKMGRKPSFTTILRDPRLAKMLGTTESKLIDIGGQSARTDTKSQTLPGFGKWQLAGRTPGGQSLNLEITDVMFTSNGGRLILGRTAELCHLVVVDDSVSKQHAQIRKDGDSFLVADRNSSNHTAVNGQFNRKPFEEVRLNDGDTLTLGEVKLDFSKA